MSSMVCQNFQSCFESRALGLQVATSNQLRFLYDMRSPPVSEFDSDIDEPQKDRNIKITTIITTTVNNNNDIVKTNLSSWSSIRALTKEVDEKKERSYVHPLVKRSSSSLSEKSLELCTENLGCETGTNVSDNINFSTSSMSNAESWRKSSPTKERSNFQQYSMHEKVNRRSFPPPLTTITSCDCVQFRPHREGGRLVIKAVAIEVSNTYFQAERGNGRLRLLLKEQFEEKEEQDQEEEEQEQEETEEEEEEDVKESSDAYLGTGEQIDENGELGIGNFQKPSRCKEGGNKELSNWEHFWVAT